MKKGYIICVDDQPEIVEALMTQLEHAVGDTCEVEVAESAEEALDVLGELREHGDQVEIVISDEIMPGIQGSKLLEMVHKIDPNIMTVMLTGYAGFDDLVYALNNGGLDWCIKKPWAYEELKNIVLDLLKKANIKRKHLRLAEEVIAEKNKAEAIVQSITDGIIVFNGNDRISLVNKACTEILGQTEEELVGKRILDILQSKELILLLAEASRRSGEVVSDEIVLKRPGQVRSETIIIAIARTLRDKDAHPWGVVMVLRDVTRERELNRMKTNFLSTVSHELRTPLTSILSTYELLLQNSLGELNVEQREFIDISKEQGVLLSELINNLIDLTTLESNQMELSTSTVNIKELALEASAFAKELATTNSLQFFSDIDDDLPPIVADETKIARMLKNLLSNAIKFTEQGEVRLNVHCAEKGIQISIADTGIGIAQEHFEQIFEKFFQVDSSSTREFSGSGLGLAICRAIVQAHNGRIWVESDLNNGSTFYVTLPLKIDK